MPQAPVEITGTRRPNVRAKMLPDASGNPVRDPISGMPLIVDESFDMDRAINLGHSFAGIADALTNDPVSKRAMIYSLMYQAFHRGGPLDMQRSYNAMAGGGGKEFVESFRPAASYVLGAVGRAAGLTPLEIQAGGGLYNLWSSKSNRNIDTSGPIFNAPPNSRWIDEGIKAHDSGRFDKPVPVPPIQSPDRADAKKSGPDFAGWTAPSEGKPDQLPLQNSTWSGAIAPPAPGGASAAATAETPSGDSSLPPQVVAGANYLNANGVPVTHRSMYLASVYGPQRVADAINNGQVGSLPAPLPDGQTQRQIRSWVQGWHGIAPAAEAAAPGGGGTSGAADGGPDDWIVPSYGQQQ